VKGVRLVRGRLSVVVPCYLVEAYLDECIDSLRNQDYADVEIIVVDDGSPDGVADIARRHAAEDPRVRLVQRPNGGLSAARNTGVEHARGEFLTFVDSDDVVTANGFALAINALHESGSDFTVSSYKRLRLDGTVTRPGRWIRQAHSRRRLAVTLEDFPDVMVNAVAWSKTYRRTFWDQAGLEFPVGMVYEDQPTSMAAFARARSFDVLRSASVLWRVRGDRSSLSQATATTKNLESHLEAVHTSLVALRENGHPRALEVRALQLLTNNLWSFVRHAATADDEYWALLRRHVIELLDVVPHEEYVAWVAAQDKVLHRLIADDRRDDVRTALNGNAHKPVRWPSHVRDGKIRLDLPFADTVDPDLSVLSDDQLRINHRIVATRWTDEGTLELDGWSYLEYVDLADNPSTTTIWLESGGGNRVEATLAPRVDPEIDATSSHWYADYRPAGWTATIDTTKLPAGGSWNLMLRVSAAGVVREEPLTRSSAYARLSGPLTARALPGGAVATLKRRPAGLVLDVRQAGAFATAVETVANTTHVHFQTEQTDATPTSVAIMRVGDPTILTSATPTADTDGRWEVALDLSGLPAALEDPSPAPEALPEPPLRFEVALSSGRSLSLLAPPSAPTTPAETVSGRAVTACPATALLEICDWTPVAAGISLGDTQVTLQVTTGSGPAPQAATMMSANLSVPGTLESLGEGRWSVTFPLTMNRFGYDGLAMRSGRYTFVLTDSADVARPVLASAALAETLPQTTLLARHRARLTGTTEPGQPLVLALAAPLTDHERGPRNQQRLRDLSRREQADIPAVFFRSLYGEVANCNSRGVHDELRRRGADLTLYWSLADWSVPVPDGGVGIIEGSSEWHRIIAGARYHMVNVHQLDWFEKPAGQVMIQTMHGYPYKIMGHDWWAKRGFPDAQVASFDERARQWDYFVSPASYATPLLRNAFLAPADATPEILEIGYPRNDVLVSAGADGIRRRTRDSLGITAEKKVVLYAPTFRDYLSSNDMAAARVDFLDVDEAAAALGPDFVILVRGHAFNARMAGGRLESTAQIIDVTDHPEINDLILASDVAVLDYSSLRFDYALTGKPMIFLVPDLEKYDYFRGGVIPYEPTAPGPLVTSTDEVTALLQDLPGLVESYADVRARFVKEYADLDDGHASARLVDAVFVVRGDAPAAD
jgi:CDP-glycerol glycerophosphotransferase